ncbi:MAG: class I SAM-dependent methyltransferase [Fimbriimonas sp.]
MRSIGGSDPSQNDEFNRASYGKIASRYAIFRPDYPQELFDAILENVDVRGTALDCATGTGQAASLLCDSFERVLAYDISPGQIEHLARRPNLFGFAARSEALPISGAVADLVTVAQAVHWFDLEKFWPEVHRISRPGAVVAIWGYGFFEVDEEIDPVVLRELRDPVAPYWGSGNLILLEEYRTIPFPFEEIASPKIVMRQQWTLDRLLDYVGTWSALNRHAVEEGPGLLERARKALLPLWGAEQVREVRMPVTLKMGRVAGPRDRTV